VLTELQIVHKIIADFSSSPATFVAHVQTHPRYQWLRTEFREELTTELMSRTIKALVPFMVKFGVCMRCDISANQVYYASDALLKAAELDATEALVNEITARFFVAREYVANIFGIANSSIEKNHMFENFITYVVDIAHGNDKSALESTATTVSAIDANCARLHYNFVG